MKATLTISLLILNVSCASPGLYIAKSMVDVATRDERPAVVEQRTVNETREVKVVNINVTEKKALEKSDDVGLNQKKVFFYPSP